MPDLFVDGMHGLGDCLHQRAVIRQFLELKRNGEEVHRMIYLRTPWPALYHDMVDTGRLRLLKANSSLRTQRLNEDRPSERAKFYTMAVPAHAQRTHIWYTYDQIKKLGSPLQAMLAGQGLDQYAWNFRLPVPKDWIEYARRWVDGVTKPIMIYRPLIVRNDWSSHNKRNPDPRAYEQLYNSIRERFHVISVAHVDDDRCREWIDGPIAQVDQRLDHGELTIEDMLGLVWLSQLVFAPMGMGVVLGQAVGKRTVCVFGGFEDSFSIEPGGRHAPTLAIQPINRCRCFSEHHDCDKRINLVQAECALAWFLKCGGL